LNKKFQLYIHQCHVTQNTMYR